MEGCRAALPALVRLAPSCQRSENGQLLACIPGALNARQGHTPNKPELEGHSNRPHAKKLNSCPQSLSAWRQRCCRCQNHQPVAFSCLDPALLPVPPRCS